MKDFPTVAFAAVIVGAGIFMVDQFDARAAWLLAFLILLTIAFRYPSFGDELGKILGGSNSNSTTGDNQESNVTSQVRAYVDQLSVPTISLN